MGNVAIIVRVIPEEQDKLQEVLEALKQKFEVKDAKEEDIGFGAKALKIMIVRSDEEGSDIESEIEEIEGVSSVTVEDVTLI
jgi:elongation factor 1-beta